MIIKFYWHDAKQNPTELIECGSVCANEVDDGLLISMLKKDNTNTERLLKAHATVYVMELGKTIDVFHYDPPGCHAKGDPAGGQATGTE